MDYNVIGIRFRQAGKIYYFDPGHLQVTNGDFVICETAKGVEYGKVVQEAKQVSEEDVVLPLNTVTRLASRQDHAQMEQNKRDAREAYDICWQKIKDHGLKMKLAGVEYTLDRNKMIFYFTADGRVDFRGLVRDLAGIFHTRIELKQIGVRDEAKMLGGIGPCGRLLCCSTFLGDFEPVSIKMAKDQNLSLNPAKISGVCGRLMCCLKYENDQYEEAKQELPDMGEKMETSYGEGRVAGLNLIERLVQVKLTEQERTVEFTLDELIEEGALST